MDIRQWFGLFSDADPHDLPAGAAQVQDNFMSLRPGRLDGRDGCREVWFENATARGAVVTNITTLPDILAVTGFRRPEGDYVVFMDGSGNVMAGRAPT